MDDDPYPDAIIFIVGYLFLLLVSFLVTLGTSALAKVSEKRLIDASEDGDKAAAKLLKLINTRPRPADTAGLYISLCAALASVLCIFAFFNPLSLYFAEKTGMTCATQSGLLVLKAVPALLIVIVSASVFAVFGVLFPKRTGSQNCERVANSLAGFLVIIKYLIFPLSWLVSNIARLLVKVFGGNPHIEESPVTEDDILSKVAEGQEEGVLEESQKEMINNIFEFDDLTAGDVMTHRTDIIAVEADDSLDEAIKKAIDEGCSRMPVYEEELDNIKGILYVKDLLQYVGVELPKDVKPFDIMREAMFIPESKKCRELFSEMTEKHLQMVIVVDEYGGLAGIVTFEDLIESIVGNIQDEFDDEQEEFEQISENVFNVDGISNIYEVEELLDIEFPKGEYETVAGYMMSVLGKVPEPNEHPSVEWEGFMFTVSEMEDRRITRVHIERLPEIENTEESEVE